jgi:hypothetical protein
MSDPLTRTIADVRKPNPRSPSPVIDPAIRNIAVYAATALLPPLADAIYQYLSTRMVTGTPVDWGQLVMIAMVSVIGAYIASTRPKAGHETQSELIDSVGHATATTVLADTAAAQVAGTQMTPFTPAQVRQIAEAMHEPVANDLVARMKTTSAGPERGA